MSRQERKPATSRVHESMDFVNVSIGPAHYCETRVRTAVNNSKLGLSYLPKANINHDLKTSLRISCQDPNNKDKLRELGNILVLTIEYRGLLDLRKLTPKELAHAKKAYNTAKNSSPDLTLNNGRRRISWEEGLRRQGLRRKR